MHALAYIIILRYNLIFILSNIVENTHISQYATAFVLNGGRSGEREGGSSVIYTLQVYVICIQSLMKWKSRELESSSQKE
jgi:hypothetical protein